MTKHLIDAAADAAACGLRLRDPTGYADPALFTIDDTEATCPGCLRAEAGRLEGRAATLRQMARHLIAQRNGEEAE